MDPQGLVWVGGEGGGWGATHLLRYVACRCNDMPRCVSACVGVFMLALFCGAIFQLRQGSTLVPFRPIDPLRGAKDKGVESPRHFCRFRLCSCRSQTGLSLNNLLFVKDSP